MIKVLIVAENASTRFGGEAILPWHYFRVLTERGVDARLIVHARTRDELLGLLPAAADRMYFLPDTPLNKICWKLGRFLPEKISEITLGFASRISTQLAARQLARRLIAEHAIDIVHQPIPVSPREPSLLHGLGAPVLIGPMNGNMTYPPGFLPHGGRRTVELTVSLVRLWSSWLNQLLPGKLRAVVLLVANKRTRMALPPGARGEVIELVENGVDLRMWQVRQGRRVKGPIRLVYIGRLIELKGVDFLLSALSQVDPSLNLQLDVIGDGPVRGALEEQARRLNLQHRVAFSGWVSQPECAKHLHNADVMVLPSLRECGGAVVLEAMACGVPVVASDWGGPADYLDPTCGILVSVASSEALIAGLVTAITRLARDPELRAELGRAGRVRAERHFDWQVKVDKIFAIYCRVVNDPPAASSC